MAVRLHVDTFTNVSAGSPISQLSGRVVMPMLCPSSSVCNDTSPSSAATSMVVMVLFVMSRMATVPPNGANMRAVSVVSRFSDRSSRIGADTLETQGANRAGTSGCVKYAPDSCRVVMLAESPIDSGRCVKLYTSHAPSWGGIDTMRLSREVIASCCNPTAHVVGADVGAAVGAAVGTLVGSVVG